MQDQEHIPQQAPVFYINPHWQQPASYPADMQGLVAQSYYPQHISTPNFVSSAPIQQESQPTLETQIAEERPELTASPKKIKKNTRCFCKFGRGLGWFIFIGMVITAFVISIIALVSGGSRYIYQPSSSSSYSLYSKRVNGTTSAVSSNLIAVSSYGYSDSNYDYTIGYGQELQEKKPTYAGQNIKVLIINKRIPIYATVTQGALTIGFSDYTQGVMRTMTPALGAYGTVHSILSFDIIDDYSLLLTFNTTTQTTHAMIVTYTSTNQITFTTNTPMRIQLSSAQYNNPTLLSVHLFNQTAVAFLAKESMGSSNTISICSLAKTMSTIKIEVCTPQVMQLTCASSNVMNLVPLKASSTTLNFLYTCGYSSVMNYTITFNGVQYRQTNFHSVSTELQSVDSQAKFIKLNYKTILAYHVKEGSLIAQVITTEFYSGYNYERNVDKFTTHGRFVIARDVSSENIQVHFAGAQIFFTYKSNLMNEYVIKVATIMKGDNGGSYSKIFDIADKVLPIQGIAGVVVVPVVAADAYTLSVTFPGAFVLKYIIRGGIRPTGIIDNSSNDYYTKQVFIRGEMTSRSYRGSMITGLKYFAKRNGEVALERSSVDGENYAVGQYVGNYKFVVDME